MTATQARRRCRCHFCEQTDVGGYPPFVDGKRRWVCDGCQERDRIDAAQEDDNDAYPDDEGAE